MRSPDVINYAASALRRTSAVGLYPAVCCALALAVSGISCQRHDDTAAQRKSVEKDDGPVPSSERLAKVDAWTRGHPTTVLATWYDVPEVSLARRRAGPEEYTAAHNRLPIGTLVRVTHLANGKTVRVRITDRGIHDRRVKLDLCKEAAEELEMVGKGIARVRLEVLEETGGSPPASGTVAAQP